MEPKFIKLMPPLDGIVNDLDDRLKILEESISAFKSRMAEFERGVAALDEKIRRIEKYAR